MVCWPVWKARNDKVWQQRVRGVEEVVVFADITLDRWRKAQDRGNIPTLRPLCVGDGLELWIKPDSGIKVNVDAAIFDQDGKYGFGVLVRDSAGSLVKVMARWQIGRIDPEVAEAIGIKEALSWAKTQNFYSIALESDSLVAVEAIRSSFKLRSAFGLVVDECKEMLGFVPHVSLNFIKRSANRGEYFIAINSRVLADRTDLESDTPPELMCILMRDCSLPRRIKLLMHSQNHYLSPNS